MALEIDILHNLSELIVSGVEEMKGFIFYEIHTFINSPGGLISNPFKL